MWRNTLTVTTGANATGATGGGGIRCDYAHRKRDLQPDTNTTLKLGAVGGAFGITMNGRAP